MSIEMVCSAVIMAGLIANIGLTCYLCHVAVALKESIADLEKAVAEIDTLEVAPEAFGGGPTRRGDHRFEIL